MLCWILRWHIFLPSRQIVCSIHKQFFLNRIFWGRCFCHTSWRVGSTYEARGSSFSITNCAEPCRRYGVTKKISIGWRLSQKGNEHAFRRWTLYKYVAQWLLVLGMYKILGKSTPTLREMTDALRQYPLLPVQWDGIRGNRVTVAEVHAIMPQYVQGGFLIPLAHIPSMFATTKCPPQHEVEPLHDIPFTSIFNFGVREPIGFVFLVFWERGVWTYSAGTVHTPVYFPPCIVMG